MGRSLLFSVYSRAFRLALKDRKHIFLFGIPIFWVLIHTFLRRAYLNLDSDDLGRDLYLMDAVFRGEIPLIDHEYLRGPLGPIVYAFFNLPWGAATAYRASVIMNVFMASSIIVLFTRLYQTSSWWIALMFVGAAICLFGTYIPHAEFNLFLVNPVIACLPFLFVRFWDDPDLRKVWWLLFASLCFVGLVKWNQGVACVCGLSLGSFVVAWRSPFEHQKKLIKSTCLLVVAFGVFMVALYSCLYVVFSRHEMGSHAHDFELFFSFLPVARSSEMKSALAQLTFETLSKQLHWIHLVSLGTAGVLFTQAVNRRWKGTVLLFWVLLICHDFIFDMKYMDKAPYLPMISMMALVLVLRERTREAIAYGMVLFALMNEWILHDQAMYKVLPWSMPLAVFVIFRLGLHDLERIPRWVFVTCAVVSAVFLATYHKRLARDWNYWDDPKIQVYTPRPVSYVNTINACVADLRRIPLTEPVFPLFYDPLINFMSGHPIPTYAFRFTSSSLDLSSKVDRALEEIEYRNVETVVMSNRNWTWGIQQQPLMEFIDRHFRLEKTYGPWNGVRNDGLTMDDRDYALAILRR